MIAHTSFFNVNKIEVSHVLKEMRAMAEELNKSSKVIEILDARIAEAR